MNDTPLDRSLNSDWQERMLPEILQEVQQLKDLFTRRLLEDKTKTAALEKLSTANGKMLDLLEEKQNQQFIKEILLLCDRIEAQERLNDFTQSVHDEIIEILARRNIVAITALETFDSRIHNAVSTVPATEKQPHMSIVGIFRNGYIAGGRLLRPADVIVAVASPKASQNQDELLEE